MWRRWAINGAIVLASLAAGLGAMEWALRAGLLNDLSIHWIAPEYKAITERIMRPSVVRSGRHPFLFNGPIVGFDKGDRYKARVIVVGDSFVWGKALPYNQVWVQKFRDGLVEAVPDTEVVGWGLNGWSTADELEFMENVTRTYGGFDADLVVVSFVVNDPAVDNKDRDIHGRKIDWKGSLVGPLAKVLPNTFDFVTNHIDMVLEMALDDYGHGDWVRYLWTDENLARYRKVLVRLKSLLDGAGIPFVFAFMPTNPNADYHRPKLAKMASILDDLGIAHVDLFPAVSRAFADGDYGQNYRKLWATPGDPHPGDAMTTILAEGVLAHLKESGTFDRLRALKPVPLDDRLAALPVCPAETGLAARIARFERYAIAEGRPYLRVQGIGLESGDGALSALKSVYLQVGDHYYAAMTRLPLNVVGEDGRTNTFNGWFVVDIPAADASAPELSAMIAVARSGCRKSWRFTQPVGPADSDPPLLEKPPTIPLDLLLRITQ